MIVRESRARLERDREDALESMRQAAFSGDRLLRMRLDTEPDP